MDTRGIAKQALARAAHLHIKAQSPDNPNDPASVQDHEEKLSELGDQVCVAILETNTSGLDRSQE